VPGADAGCRAGPRARTGRPARAGWRPRAKPLMATRREIGVLPFVTAPIRPRDQANAAYCCRCIAGFEGHGIGSYEPAGLLQRSALGCHRDLRLRPETNATARSLPRWDEGGVRRRVLGLACDESEGGEAAGGHGSVALSRIRPHTLMSFWGMRVRVMVRCTNVAVLRGGLIQGERELRRAAEVASHRRRRWSVRGPVGPRLATRTSMVAYSAGNEHALVLYPGVYVKRSVSCGCHENGAPAGWASRDPDPSSRSRWTRWSPPPATRRRCSR